MGFRIVRNELPEARKLIRAFAQKSAPRIAARVLRARIIARTLAGRTVEGTPMDPYTPGYKKFRAKHGLPTRPNLYGMAIDGQHMIYSLDYYDRLTVSAGTGHALAVSAEVNSRAVGNQRTRPWCGISASDRTPIERALLNGYNRLKLGEPLPFESIGVETSPPF